VLKCGGHKEQVVQCFDSGRPNQEIRPFLSKGLYCSADSAT
jgi:hypothetical protein